MKIPEYWSIFDEILFIYLLLKIIMDILVISYYYHLYKMYNWNYYYFLLTFNIVVNFEELEKCKTFTCSQLITLVKSKVGYNSWALIVKASSSGVLTPSFSTSEII